ncbi:NAD-dependent epimerase/dehydratase family protein [Ruegeria arenilitoris]|uniref:NAD-dependent epimerase/dehydratase family protein n=1 Tax=Ruegeria arenilitoris TaxID=1173585 RepID=UPI00147DA5F9|nr:NAD(P)-dependent oxidoreductase [Ruegeria arenilitoris]
MDSLTEPFLIEPSRVTGTILVTGAGGCIGSWVVAILANSGAKVVAFDLREDRRRLSLLIDDEAASCVTWEVGDISNQDQLYEICGRHNVTAVIHLAGLMIPFCKADPALGARVNVEGTINVLEVARRHGLKRLAYASSSAVHGMPPGGPTIATLYGAYKLANEYTAEVYSLDWGVPSVGIRPNVVYGVGRDQGMTSEFSVGLAHSVIGKPFRISYGGPLSWLYAGEAASAFIASVSKDGERAVVFDLNGTCMTVEEGLEILSSLDPAHEITTTGDMLPVPADLSDQPIRDYLGDYPSVKPAEGIRWTLEAFRRLHSEGKLAFN